MITLAIYIMRFVCWYRFITISAYLITFGETVFAILFILRDHTAIAIYYFTAYATHNKQLSITLVTIVVLIVTGQEYYWRYFFTLITSIVIYIVAMRADNIIAARMRSRWILGIGYGHSPLAAVALYQVIGYVNGMIVIIHS